MRDDDDRDDGRPRTRDFRRDDSPGPTFTDVVPTLYGVGKWMSLGMGLILLTVGLTRDNVLQVVMWVAVACFCGILARVLQAEEHRGRGA